MGAYDEKGKLVASRVENNIRNHIKEATVEATQNKFPLIVSYNNGHKYGVLENGNIVENILGPGDSAPTESNAIYISGDFVAVVPAGYTISNKKIVNEETGIVEQDETTIENGLVVKDGSGNEFVWIPVENISDLYDENKTNSNWIMFGTSEDNAVITNYKSKSEIIASYKRGNPGETIDSSKDYIRREPDTVVGNGTKYDADENLRGQAGFFESNGTTVSSLDKMAIELRDDYINMIDSIRKNGGFYVGRYELGKDSNNKPQVKVGSAYTYTNGYKLYAECKSFSNNNVESRMIWGCLWDQVCKFISTAEDKDGNKIILTDSSSYGNYSGKKIATGSNSNFKINNIYDLAGNCIEITQEAEGIDGRICRGGSYFNSGDTYSVISKAATRPSNWEGHMSTRPVLYLK